MLLKLCFKKKREKKKKKKNKQTHRALIQLVTDEILTRLRLMSLFG